MAWFRILLNKDQVRAGEIKNLQQGFRDTFHKAGMPNEMGLFAGQPLGTGELPFYLTPASSKPAESLISDYSGTACERPVKSGLEPTFVIGFNKAWDLLGE